MENFEDVSQSPNHHIIKGDIRDANTVDSIFEKYEIDCVVHFAAESHVDRSINNPYSFVTTNVLGTHILLDAAKNHWKLRPDNRCSRDFRSGVRFIQISTDEVYGTLSKKHEYIEKLIGFFRHVDVSVFGFLN